jgi:tRNA(adenine34) deaminase
LISNSKDNVWMTDSLMLAKKASMCGVVYKDLCIARSYNKTITNNDPCAHAEVLAIKEAAKYIKNHRLVGCTLYVTLEPCLMCIGAVIQARISRLVYAAQDTRIGILTKNKISSILSEANHSFIIDSGILAKESSKLLQDFFLNKR